MNFSYREEIIKRDKRCFICKSKKSLDVHHIIPREKGGLDDYGNLITLCSSCHRRNHNTVLKELSTKFLDYTSNFKTPENWGNFINYGYVKYGINMKPEVYQRLKYLRTGGTSYMNKKIEFLLDFYEKNFIPDKIKRNN